MPNAHTIRENVIRNKMKDKLFSHFFSLHNAVQSISLLLVWFFFFCSLINYLRGYSKFHCMHCISKSESMLLSAFFLKPTIKSWPLWLCNSDLNQCISLWRWEEYAFGVICPCIFRFSLSHSQHRVINFSAISDEHLVIVKRPSFSV